MIGFSKTVVKLLKEAGYHPERNPRGSHVIWGNGNTKVSVPAKIKSRYTANAILKEAGIKVKL